MAASRFVLMALSTRHGHPVLFCEVPEALSMVDRCQLRTQLLSRFAAELNAMNPDHPCTLCWPQTVDALEGVALDRLAQPHVRVCQQECSGCKEIRSSRR
jgi:hypothetical protein